MRTLRLLKSERATPWAETPEQIVGLSRTAKKEEGTCFQAYCEAVRSSAHQRIFVRSLGHRGRFERQYARAMRHAKTNRLPGPKILSDAGRLLWPTLMRAESKAQSSLPKYFGRVRALLHAHLREWLKL